MGKNKRKRGEIREAYAKICKDNKGAGKGDETPENLSLKDSSKVSKSHLVHKQDKKVNNSKKNFNKAGPHINQKNVIENRSNNSGGVNRNCPPGRYQHTGYHSGSNQTPFYSGMMPENCNRNFAFGGRDSLNYRSYSHSQWRPQFGEFYRDGWYDGLGYDYYGTSNFEGIGNQNKRYPDDNPGNFQDKNYFVTKGADKRFKDSLQRKDSVQNKPRRSEQNVSELKKKLDQQKKVKASELVKDLQENSEIAGKAAKIKEVLGSLPSNYIFSPQHEGTDQQQIASSESCSGAIVPPRVKIDKLMVPDLILTASDYAEVGTGKNLANPVAANDLNKETSVESPRPSILPVLHDGQVVPPPSTGQQDTAPKSRVAYNNLGGDKIFLRRKRTLSESSCLLDPPAKQIRRERTNSEAVPGSKSVDEAMGQIIDKKRVDKLKTSLSKMNKKSLKELVDNPTSTKSRLLMRALVQENRNFISSSINRSRFGRFQPGENEVDVLADDDLDKLPSNVMLEISDMIKQEVPDIEVDLDIKREEDYDLGIDLNVKCEVEYGEGRQEYVEQVSVDDSLKILDSVSGEEASTSKPKAPNEKGHKNTSNNLDEATRLAPVHKKKGRPPKGSGRKIGGHEVIIGSVSDLVSVEGYGNSNKASDNDCEEIDLEVEPPQEQGKEHENTNKMKSISLIFEQESRLLSDLESVDSRMATLAQERSGIMQQLLFLSELKRQMFKES